jgi:major histocompatibility complex class I
VWIFILTKHPNVKNKNLKIKKKIEPGVVAHAFNPSTREAVAGGFLSSRTAWSTK